MGAKPEIEEVDEAQLHALEASGAIELDADEYVEIIRFGDVQEGDVLLGSKGRTNVLEAFESHTPETMYVLETSSGIQLKMSANHLLYVVTANNRDLHRTRLTEGKKLGKSLSKESVEILEELAESADSKEALVAEFEHFIEPKSRELRSTLIRVAESLGPVSESHLYVDDLEASDDPLFSTTIFNYDRRLFAQQLLSVLSIGKARRRWTTIVGTVLTAEMLTAYDIEDIYIPDPPEVL